METFRRILWGSLYFFVVWPLNWLIQLGVLSAFAEKEPNVVLIIGFTLTFPASILTTLALYYNTLKKRGLYREKDDFFVRTGKEFRKLLGKKESGLEPIVVPKMQESAPAPKPKKSKPSFERYAIPKYKKTEITVSYDLKTAKKMVKKFKSKKLQDTRSLKAAEVDEFLYSGKYNSVIGTDGFSKFKNKMKSVVSDANKGDGFGSSNQVLEALLSSGVYYEDAFIPDDMKSSLDDQRWLTAYRYIAKNFPEISVSDFNTIVARFRDSRGFSFYVEPSDSKALKEVGTHSELFDEVIDPKLALMHINMNIMRDICKEHGIQPGRSRDETSNRILEALGEKVMDYVPKEFKKRRTLRIRDEELASGDDFIHISEYIQAMSKSLHSDFREFYDIRTQWRLMKKSS